MTKEDPKKTKKEPGYDQKATGDQIKNYPTEEN